MTTLAHHSADRPDESAKVVSVRERNRTQRWKNIGMSAGVVVLGVGAWFGRAEYDRGRTEAPKEVVGLTEDRMKVLLSESRELTVASNQRQLSEFKADVQRQIDAFRAQLEEYRKEVKAVQSASDTQQAVLNSLVRSVTVQMPNMADKLATIAETVARIDERTKRP